MMDTFLISVVSIVVGVIATIAASRYYYRRTTERALTPYVQFYTSVFRGVEPELRDNLKILYKDVAVTDLLEVQFLVANTGFRPIRGIIDPLTLQIPEECELLDATVLHVSPEERRVKVSVLDGAVAFVFPLLNAGEFFIAKLLLKGEADPRELKFRITAEDLPPVLRVEFLAPDLIRSEQDRKFEKGMFIFGLVVAFTGAAVAGLIYEQLNILAAVLSGGIVAFQRNWLLVTCVVVASVPTLLLLVMGPMLMVGSFTDFSFPRRRRFAIPSDFRRHSFYARAGGVVVPLDFYNSEARNRDHEGKARE